MTSAEEMDSGGDDAPEGTVRVPSTVWEDFGPRQWRAAVLSTVGVVEDD